MNIFEVSGVIGLLSITLGVLLKNRKEEDILYVIGGLFLEVYSIYLHDGIFIILQIVFVLSAAYDLLKNKKTH